MVAPTCIGRDLICAFRLSSHHLDRRLPPDTIAEASAACGIQDSPPGSAALALAARVQGHSLEELAGAVETDRSLLRIRSLRGAPHFVPTSDMPIFTTGLLPTDEEESRYFIRGASEGLDTVGITAARLVDLAAPALLDALDGRSVPFRALSTELTERVAGKLAAGHLAAWRSPGPFAEEQSLGEALVHFALYLLALHGLYCFALRQGDEAAFVRVDQWLGGPLPRVEPAAAQAELVRRYLRCYGPSTPRHFAEWAGVAPSFAARSWALIEPELVEVALDRGRAWLRARDLPKLQHPPEPGGVRLLPPHDPYLSLRDRATLLPDTRLHREVWKPVGNSGAVLYAGEMVGLWRPQKKGRLLRVTVELFTPLGEETQAAIQVEASRVALIRGGNTVEVIFASR